jgi:hypothetical protein
MKNLYCIMSFAKRKIDIEIYQVIKSTFFMVAYYITNEIQPQL